MWSRVKAGLKHATYGILGGFALYIAYGVMAPALFTSIGIMPPEDSIRILKPSGAMLAFLALFISLESIASALRGTVFAFIFKAISRLMGIFLFVTVVNMGVIERTFAIEGVYYTVKISVFPLIAAIVLFTLPLIVLDARSMLCES